ncbi:MAG: hypothetical protein ABL966_16955, partial [Acidimicrobiales bacterium]
MPEATKAAIAIDPWKLGIFTRRLNDAGYAFENCGALTPSILVLRVDTDDLVTLGAVVRAANDEARKEFTP